ncbi:hypothetical protein ACFB49_30230 [Sphingomonas sp. DBB INV C78]|uniref:hypothetical protein n=1 Tax=Sphingomonas sp. DBB INV C78 TaxID=3349434 RepID=UPI0036D385EA
MLVMVAGGFLLIRSRPIRYRLAFGLIVLAVLAPVLAHRDALPLPPSDLGMA